MYPNIVADLIRLVVVTAMAVVVLGAMVIVLIRSRRMAKPKSRISDEARWCGYNLEGLEIPRCPECGRVVGFDKSFDELGIREDDVRRHVHERREELRNEDE